MAPNEKEVLAFFARLDQLAEKIKRLEEIAQKTGNKDLLKQTQSYHRLMNYSVLLGKRAKQIMNGVEQDVDETFVRMN